MRIAVIGAGYVGLVTGACLSQLGWDVLCVDNDEDKINGLTNGVLPIHEPGLEDIIFRSANCQKLEFTSDLEWAVETCEVIFIAVGTPSLDDGSADLNCIIQVAKDIGHFMTGCRMVINKSTVPVGTGHTIGHIIQRELDRRQVNYSFDIISNPEFLREGNAVEDFLHPDRVVVGTESEAAAGIMIKIYRALLEKGTPFVITNLVSAEMIKYACNAFLAAKITFINEIANLCEPLGVNVRHVALAMGLDRRIGPDFLQPGPGYGGACFPKDTRALVSISEQVGAPLTLVQATIIANQNQRFKMVEKIAGQLGGLYGKTIGLLGLTFKPNTDDIRESPALTIIEELVNRGAFVKAYDPIGIENTARWIKADKHREENVKLCSDEYEVADQCNALVILTDWKQFKNLDLSRIKALLAEPFFFDLRNMYLRQTVEEHGLRYYGVGL
ncbi:MAG: UDP-glucose dehydrogenase family protein [Chitinophagales bacterium]